MMRPILATQNNSLFRNLDPKNGFCNEIKRIILSLKSDPSFASHFGGIGIWEQKYMSLSNIVLFFMYYCPFKGLTILRFYFHFSFLKNLF